MIQRPALPGDPVVLAYFGHHKCASTYVIRILRQLCGVLGLRWHEAYLPQELPYGYHLREPYRTRLRQLLDSVARFDFDFIAHGNADQALLSLLGSREFRGFHVIRDPRDIVVSGYFSHLNSHPAEPDHNPWLVDHRAALVGLEQEAGLLCEIEFCEPYFARMSDWDYQNPAIYETRFEVITQSPESEFRRVLDFLGIPVNEKGLGASMAFLGRRAVRKLGGRSQRIPWIPGRVLDDVIGAKSFRSSAGGRATGTENVKSHYRKGISGDWKNYFTPPVKEAFKDRYGSLLVDLGYADDLDW